VPVGVVVVLMLMAVLVSRAVRDAFETPDGDSALERVLGHVVTEAQARDDDEAEGIPASS
jgi:hypothetical protein